MLFKRKLAVATMFAAMFFTACENNNDDAIVENMNKKIALENPYEFVGVQQNEKLTQFAEYLKGDIYFSSQDLYEFNKDRNPEFNVSIADYEQNLDESMDLTYKFMFEDKTALQEILKSDVLNKYILEFRDVMLNVINSSSDITPSQFGERIVRLEESIMNDETFEKEEYQNDRIILLATMSIARHSYAYWYAAYTQPTHPWYNMIDARIKYLNDNMSAKAKEKKGFWSKVVTIAKCVVATVATVPADVVGALSSGNTTVNGNRRETTYDLEKMIDKGAEVSADVWEWSTKED